MEVALLFRIFPHAHFRLGLQAKGAEIGEQMPENLEPVTRGKAIELQHDRRVKRSDVAVPDVVRNTGKKDVGIPAFERSRHRHFGNGMAPPEIFAQEDGVDARSVATHDYVLVVVGKNLRLDEIARAEQISYLARFAHCTERTLAEVFRVAGVGALQFFPSQRGKFFALAKTEMPRHIEALEAHKGTHSNIVKLREQKRIDKMAAIDCELRVIDRLLGDLQS